jgi:hypothetical protein
MTIALSISLDKPWGTNNHYFLLSMEKKN